MSQKTRTAGNSVQYTPPTSATKGPVARVMAKFFSSEASTEAEIEKLKRKLEQAKAEAHALVTKHASLRDRVEDYEVRLKNCVETCSMFAAELEKCAGMMAARMEMSSLTAHDPYPAFYAGANSVFEFAEKHTKAVEGKLTEARAELAAFEKENKAHLEEIEFEATRHTDHRASLV